MSLPLNFLFFLSFIFSALEFGFAYISRPSHIPFSYISMSYPILVSRYSHDVCMLHQNITILSLGCSQISFRCGACWQYVCWGVSIFMEHIITGECSTKDIQKRCRIIHINSTKIPCHYFYLILFNRYVSSAYPSLSHLESGDYYILQVT